MRLYWSWLGLSILGFSWSALLFAHDRGAGTLDPLIRAKFAEHKSIYEHLHRNPELSQQERATSALMADEMRKMGFAVTANVGGFGVVAVLENGPGPVGLIRTDMDALPLQEETGLPYSSEVPGVMHACGHDMHMAMWLGTAHVLSHLRDQWAGTLVMIAQPAEEIVAGARTMIADGLYTRFPKPEYGLAMHLTGKGLKGMVYARPGFVQAAFDSFFVKFVGRGTHGATPHLGISPINLFAEFSLKLNTLVAHEVDPLEPAVITLGKVVSGTKDNIVPETAETAGTIRTYSLDVREYLKRRLVQVATAVSTASNAPDPEVRFTGSTRANYNNPDLMNRLLPEFWNELGRDHVEDGPQAMTSEDFSEYGPAGDIPTAFFFIGTSESLPPQFSNHSPRFFPPFDPTYATGVRAMVRAVLKMQSGSGSIRSGH